MHALCKPLALDRPTPGSAWRLTLPPGACGAPASACVLLDYTAAGFDASQFGAAGLDCPPALARSVLERQAEFFHGRLAARAAQQALGCMPGPVGVGPQRQPLWPAGLCGSISHSRRWAAAWVGHRTAWQGLGLDIEPLLAPADQDLVQAQALTPDEALALRAAAGPDPARQALHLTLAFSAKEALFKAVFAHCGRLLGFDTSRCERVAADRVQLVLTQPLAPGLPAGRCFALDWLALDAQTVLTRIGW